MERETRFDGIIAERVIEEKDKLSPSPEERANAVWAILVEQNPRPTLWDLVCFSTQVLALAVEPYPYITQAVRVLNRLIYAAHYYGTERFASFIEKENG